MNHKLAKDLSLVDAKKAAGHIIEVPRDFLNSIEKVFPGKGYGDLANAIDGLKNDIENCNGTFLDESKIDWYINQLLATFTAMNPEIEKNLQDLLESYKEISDFLFNNNTNIEFKLLDFEHKKIEKMKTNVFDSNRVLYTLKQQNYKNIVALRGLFSTFSSTIATTESSFLDELIQYRDRINQFAKNNEIQYNFPFDPVTIFGVGGIIQRNNEKFYTKQRALRHLMDHDHFEINTNNDPITIHFKSPSDPNWTFQFDETYTVEEFFNYVANVDLFYKSAVSLMFTLMLNAVLRQCFKS